MHVRELIIIYKLKSDLITSSVVMLEHNIMHAAKLVLLMKKLMHVNQEGVFHDINVHTANYNLLL